ncbi:putative uncharacterized protein [Clostridium sp. CAG:413]|nr:putative uncharacterized protein [Clostridium sp. CAG:413]
MSMTRSEFNMAFSTVIAEEFADVPDESEIEVEFSDEFNRKMQELIDSIGANNGQKPKNDRKSRLNIKGLIALAATLALLLAGLVSVNATGNPIANFIVKTYENFKEILFAGDGAAEIDHVYAFTEVPDGFTETERVLNDDMSFVRYENSETGAVIELSQTTINDNSFVLDYKNGNTKTFRFADKEVKVYDGDFGTYCAFWLEDTYNMKLTYLGSAKSEDLIKMINMVD